MRIAYDLIGSKEKAVAIIDSKHIKNLRAAAKEIMKRHNNVKSVLARGARYGKYRKYAAKVIAGSKDTEVYHKEYGYVLKLDPQKVYFSPREANERNQIAEIVKKNERILILFSGIAPRAIAIAKQKPNCKIVCVDANPDAVKYADLNCRINNVENVENICSDVTKVKLGKFDRIMMPLPESAHKFLKIALKHAKKGGVIHIYGVSKEKKVFSDFEHTVKTALKGKRFKIVGRKRVLPFAPHKWKVRFDLKVI